MAKVNARLKAKYHQEIRPALQKELGLNNPMAVPRLEKIVLNIVSNAFKYTLRGEIAVRVSIKSYLYGAVRYRALNLVARNKVEATWLAQALQNGAPALATERAADDQIVIDEQVSALKEAVNELPPKRRSVFVLRSTTQMSYAEIAEVLQTSVKNVEVQLRRATHSLRAALPQHAD